MGGSSLKGCVALITGGGGEIGSAIARKFAEEGANIAVGDLDLEKAKTAVAAIRASGGQAEAFSLDVASPLSCGEAVDGCVRMFGYLTSLINVAAAPPSRGTVEGLTLEDWNKTLAVNLTGAFLTCKYAVPEMRRAGGGSITNIASQLGHVGMPGNSAYCTSKAALIFFTRVLAMDHASDNIRANTISPGAIATQRLIGRSGGSFEAATKLHGPRHLLGRLGLPEEVAGAAAYLASPVAAFVTATDLLVDGGYVAFKGTVDAKLKPSL